MMEREVTGNEPWLINNSTKEERQKRINGAIAIQSTGGGLPTPKAMELYQKYIDGEMEIEEIRQEILKNYKKYI